jgi:CBS-domain-containing membrane protein
VSSSSAERFVGVTAADVMLASPKTLPDDVTVRAARAALANDGVQMLVLVDGPRFAGAITDIPPDADPDERALRYATAAETITPDEDATVAFERAGSSPDRRIVVLDEGGDLLGLLCLNTSRTRFCGGKVV